MADAVPISGPVAGRMTHLVITRDGNKIKVEWKIPRYLADLNYGRRVNWVDSEMDFACSPDSSPQRVEVWKSATLDYQKPIETTTNADHYWIRGLEKEGDWQGTANAGEDYEKPYDRNRYYPKTSKKCTAVNVEVHGGNNYGESSHPGMDEGIWGRGPKTYGSFAFTRPQTPEPDFERWDLSSEESYAAKFSVKANPAADDEAKTNAERYDTRYRILRQDNLPGSGYASKKVVRNWTAFTAEDYDGTVNAVPNLLQLQESQWVEYTLEAHSRGMWGDSQTASCSIVASRPAIAAVTGVSVSSLDMVRGVVTVNVRIPSNARRWTTKAKLQRAKDVNASWDAARVARDASWSDVTNMAQIDQEHMNATWTTGFTDSVVAAYPSQPNLRTWYRVVTENDLYSGDAAYYSLPFEARQLYREQTATNDRVYIEDMGTNEDATAVRVKLGWPTDDSTGTEVSWSQHPDAWESSEQPSTSLVTWEDETTQGAYDHSATFTIYGVEQGQALYVKARRYFEGEDGGIVDYSPYATAMQQSQYPFTPAMPPSDVRLSAPAYVRRGSDVPLTWTFQSEAPQTAWACYLVDESGRQAVASGEDSYGACTVPASMLPGDSARLVVSVTTGSEWADSQEAEVRFADPPVIGAQFPSAADPDYATTYPLLLEQPMALYCSSDTGDDMLRVRVVSKGVSYSLPDGDEAQLDGDPVFDAWVAPEWGLAEDGSYYTCVTLPTDVPFVDVGVYEWSVTGENVTTGLVSEPVTGQVKVRWAHQAHIPGAGSTAAVQAAGRTVTVTPERPDNVADADVFDLYRVTPDGVDLVAAGVRYGSAVTDRFAPFGRASLAYRICTRTSDGDISWLDVPYELKCLNLRLDWAGGSLELPYNLVRQDSWSKDFEERAHLDGSRGGFWNAGASRSASLSTDMVRFDSEEDQRSLRSLARHAGPVFVRLPNGCAYQANVDVGGLDETYQSGAVSVSLSATQVDLTDEFRAALSDIDTSAASDYEEREYMRSQVLCWGPEAPSAGQQFELLEEPSGDVLVELTASHDYYSDAWPYPNTVSGATVTLGELAGEAADFVAEALAEGANIRLMARYDVGE